MTASITTKPLLVIASILVIAMIVAIALPIIARSVRQDVDAPEGFSELIEPARALARRQSGLASSVGSIPLVAAHCSPDNPTVIALEFETGLGDHVYVVIDVREDDVEGGLGATTMAVASVAEFTAMAAEPCT